VIRTTQVFEKFQRGALPDQKGYLLPSQKRKNDRLTGPSLREDGKKKGIYGGKKGNGFPPEKRNKDHQVTCGEIEKAGKRGPPGEGGRGRPFFFLHGG